METAKRLGHVQMQKMITSRLNQQTNSNDNNGNNGSDNGSRSDDLSSVTSKDKENENEINKN